MGASKPIKTQNSPSSLNKSYEKEDYRLSTFLKKSGGKASRNESEKNFEAEKHNPQLLGYGAGSKSYYDGPKNFEENFDTNSVMSKFKIYLF